MTTHGSWNSAIAANHGQEREFCFSWTGRGQIVSVITSPQDLRLSRIAQRFEYELEIFEDFLTQF